MNEKKVKKKNNSKGNKKIIILVTLLVLLLIVCFIITAINFARVKEEESIIDNKKSYENTIEEVKKDFIENGEIVPNRYNMFERMYEGNVVTDQVYPAIYNLVTVTIPDIQRRFKGKKSDEVEKFYKENKDRIEKNLGIDNVDDYIKIVYYLKDLELGEYVDSTFDEMNSEELEKGYKVPLEIVFSKQTIKINMEIDKELSNKNPIKFKAQ